MKKYVITIGRQYGAGAHEISEKLSKRLGIPYYDKELLKQSAKDSGIDERLFKFYDEKPTKSFLYALSTEGFPMAFSNTENLQDKIFNYQYSTIQKLADKESCIIVGRCADYILKDYENLLTVFLHADYEYRLNRVINLYGVSAKESKDRINQNDKKRAQFHNFHSPDKWGGGETYDLNINVSRLGIDETVELIAKYAELKFTD